ncbi:MAG: saccharopine dehydrogenase NADP-binding domain-containing protein, partial [Deltaproteobacteria bacterium]|nr:saccharopine dehydrogenase NADP-binding domain-containing protein [Deltaproteobacteria bacterium]
MKNVLLLGAGLVTRPLVCYLLDKGVHLTVATRTVDRAQALLGGHPRGVACTLDLSNPEGLDGLIAGADLVISLVPYTWHVQVARRCIALRRNMITTSYVSPAMRELDPAAREAGILILNEIGVDPGIDHMSAMKVIHRVRAEGGRVRGFRSCTGGLPAPSDNDNPWGYKFSWSPRGVLMAGRNPAKWLEDGRLVEIPGPELFLHHWPLEVPGLGVLESYPNRDSLGYMGLYGLEGVETMFRGTLRYPGWCVAIKQLVDLGWLDMEERPDLPGRTYAQLGWRLLGKESGHDLQGETAARLGVPRSHDGLERMAWAGLFGGGVVPRSGTSYLDALCALLEPKLAYAPG